ncbi:FkbM family methyltransferase [Moraxella sp. ZJ142]|uniref:FkbM family methyltransferase n=1 Tax=Moraxella marmotae TaxID=3344520 RepID=UPI0035D4DD8B
MKTTLHNLRHGLFSLIEGDFISNYGRIYGEWSELEVRFFQSILTATDNVIEVGSNIGMHAVPIAKHLTQGRLFCFEPQRIIFQQLCCNLALNQLTNVHAYHTGVSDSQGSTQVQSSDYTTQWNYGAFSINKGYSTEFEFTGDVHHENLNLIDLDSHPDLANLPALKLLKIDAEGFDKNVLQGGVRLINRLKPIIFVEAHPHHSDELLSYFDSLDYQCYWFISHRYQPDNFCDSPEFADFSGLDANFVCYHRSNLEAVPSYLAPVQPLSTYPKNEQGDSLLPLIINID